MRCTPGVVLAAFRYSEVSPGTSHSRRSPLSPTHPLQNRRLEHEEQRRAERKERAKAAAARERRRARRAARAAGKVAASIDSTATGETGASSLPEDARSGLFNSDSDEEGGSSDDSSDSGDSADSAAAEAAARTGEHLNPMHTEANFPPAVRHILQPRRLKLDQGKGHMPNALITCWSQSVSSVSVRYRVDRSAVAAATTKLKRDEARTMAIRKQLRQDGGGESGAEESLSSGTEDDWSSDDSQNGITNSPMKQRLRRARAADVTTARAFAMTAAATEGSRYIDPADPQHDAYRRWWLTLSTTERFERLGLSTTDLAAMDDDRVRELLSNPPYLLRDGSGAPPNFSSDASIAAQARAEAAAAAATAEDEAEAAWQKWRAAHAADVNGIARGGGGGGGAAGAGAGARAGTAGAGAGGGITFSSENAHRAAMRAKREALAAEEAAVRTAEKQRRDTRRAKRRAAAVLKERERQWNGHFKTTGHRIMKPVAARAIVATDPGMRAAASGRSVDRVAAASKALGVQGTRAAGSGKGRGKAKGSQQGGAAGKVKRVFQGMAPVEKPQLGEVDRIEPPPLPPAPPALVTPGAPVISYVTSLVGNDRGGMATDERAAVLALAVAREQRELVRFDVSGRAQEPADGEQGVRKALVEGSPTGRKRRGGRGGRGKRGPAARTVRFHLHSTQCCSLTLVCRSLLQVKLFGAHAQAIIGNAHPSTIGGGPNAYAQVLLAGGDWDVAQGSVAEAAEQEVLQKRRADREAKAEATRRQREAERAARGTTLKSPAAAAASEAAPGTATDIGKQFSADMLVATHNQDVSVTELRSKREAAQEAANDRRVRGMPVTSSPTQVKEGMRHRDKVVALFRKHSEHPMSPGQAALAAARAKRGAGSPIGRHVHFKDGAANGGGGGGGSAAESRRVALLRGSGDSSVGSDGGSTSDAGGNPSDADMEWTGRRKSIQVCCRARACVFVRLLLMCQVVCSRNVSSARLKQTCLVPTLTCFEMQLAVTRLWSSSVLRRPLQQQ